MKKTLLTLTALLSTTAFAGGAAAPVAAEGTVTVNGAQVYYKATGSGQPLLLIHGYP
ncbi:hypothetical protein MSS93_11485 [Deinococcus radiodurans]|nr:hypothetical protein MSS93_11485 [Deinococcus radiodurans]